MHVAHAVRLAVSFTQPVAVSQAVAFAVAFAVTFTFAVALTDAESVASAITATELDACHEQS